MKFSVLCKSPENERGALSGVLAIVGCETGTDKSSGKLTAAIIITLPGFDALSIR